MLIWPSVALPVLDNTSVCSALVVLSVCCPKLRAGALRDATPMGKPLPFKAIAFGLLSASLVTTRPKALEFKPNVVGVKVTLILQLVKGAKLEPQVLLLMPKLPLATMLAMWTTAGPALYKLTGWAGLVIPRPCAGKFIEDAGLIEVGLPCPVPLRAMVCGLPGALLVTVTVPFCGAMALGVKLMSSVQEPFGFNPPPQFWLTL